MSDSLSHETRASQLWLEGLRDSRESFVADAKQELRDAGLVFDGRDAVTVAAPLFLDRQSLAGDDFTVHSCTAALQAAAEMVLADADLAERCMPGFLDGGPAETLMRIDPGYKTPLVFGRYDGTRIDGKLSVLELNGGIPGGVLGTDQTAAVMAGWSPMQHVTEQFDVSHAHVGDRIAESLRVVWDEFGGTGVPHIFIAVPTELSQLAAPAIAHLERSIKAAGMPISVVEPGELVHADGRLRHNGEPVDVLMRAFFTFMLPALGERADAIVSAVAAGDVCMVTSFRSGLLGHKSLFALVTDPAVDLALDADVAQEARRALPWTRLVTTGLSTDPSGSEVDLVDYARAAQQQLVLKPGEGYGGHGVTLGWEKSEQEWSQALQTALDQPGWILQNRLPLLEADLPELAPGFPVTHYTGDINPLVTLGAVAGYYIRVARGGMTNMSSGDGSTTTAFVIDPR